MTRHARYVVLIKALELYSRAETIPISENKIMYVHTHPDGFQEYVSLSVALGEAHNRLKGWAMLATGKE